MIGIAATSSGHIEQLSRFGREAQPVLRCLGGRTFDFDAGASAGTPAAARVLAEFDKAADEAIQILPLAGHEKEQEAEQDESVSGLPRLAGYAANE